jgi:hypothetical protein
VSSRRVNRSLPAASGTSRACLRFSELVVYGLRLRQAAKESRSAQYRGNV